MRILEQFLIVLCITVITSAQSTDNPHKLISIIKDGLEEVYRKTNYITQRLQENLIEVVNQGKEKLFVLKEKLRVTAEKSDEKCKENFKQDFQIFIKTAQESLKTCSGEVIQSSQEYRQTVEDDIEEINSGVDLHKKTNKCFAVNNIENSECTYQEVIENDRVAEGLADTFKEIVEESREYAVEVLSDFMECNKIALKEAKEKQVVLMTNLLDCID